MKFYLGFFRITPIRLAPLSSPGRREKKGFNIILYCIRVCVARTGGGEREIIIKNNPDIIIIIIICT